MTKRSRAIAFACAAGLCAALAASAAGGYRSDLEATLGELTPVLVTTRSLPGGRPLSARTARSATEERRVPVRFLPPGALTAPEQLVGRAPIAPVPPGGYLLESQLRLPGERRGGSSRAPLDPGRRPVEIAVEGAGALNGNGPVPRRVDVIVTDEPGATGGEGRTYVAARAVELLGLRETTSGNETDVVPGPGAGGWRATLALTREEALRLIQAESYARSVRLLAR